MRRVKVRSRRAAAQAYEYMSSSEVSALLFRSLATLLLLVTSSTPQADAMAVTPTSTRATVAVLGSGAAGSTAARKLAEAGMKVSVFECGFGVGGRTSTRITRDDHKFAFDHGAQYIGSPKTEDFRQALAEWQAAEFVKEWKGQVVDISASSADPKGYALTPDDGGKQRACATYNDKDGKWTLTSHGDRRDLGQFDWLVGGDRLSATNGRADLRDAPLSNFAEKVNQIGSLPCLVLMIAFESPLQIPYDGITFGSGKCDAFGSLGWIARDTSKPGRERDDECECWVVQSNPDAATQVLELTSGEADFEKRRELVREKAKELLMNDFLALIRKLSDNGAAIPPIVSAVGHRWSAAFPSPPKSCQAMDCFIDIDHKFIACGDYVGKLTGRVEGAYLSGLAAASALLDAQSKI